ncbi:hypothetical protein D9611_008687 [Ephemerocybe angulata]|uniref:RSE1/DDB1/CPSF1 first beta-propeller domain-containing protein n=1 Tax=Ephemerocybe angulata TaxID=980116 RepID=A0A8H5CBZ6_9AGAR|nr:hypothetical protein D9611_008687 [Tulosesus angulatus]
MKVVTTFHASSSVVSSAKCCLTASRELEFLVVAKLNRIEVYSLQASGLQYECGVDVWGKVLCVKALPIQGTNRSKLVVMISHPDPEVIFLAYEAVADGKKELVVNHSLSLRERSSRPAEFFNDLLVHPSGQLVVAHCYTGRIKVIFVEAGDYEQDFDCAFSECNVLSMAILPTYEDELYTLAILHIDALQRIQLISRELSNQETGWELSPTPSMLLPPTAISDKTFPTPTDNIPRLIPVNPADEGEGEGRTRRHRLPRLS